MYGREDIYAVRPGKPEIPKDMGFFTQNTNRVPSILGRSISPLLACNLFLIPIS